eukprot:2307388-Prymnesium_polylepis.1
MDGTWVENPDCADPTHANSDTDLPDAGMSHSALPTGARTSSRPVSLAWSLASVFKHRDEQTTRFNAKDNAAVADCGRRERAQLGVAVGAVPRAVG